jgi:hypothetical protein
LAVTYDGTTLKTYVDGVEQTSQNASLTTTFTNYMIGRNRNADSFFAGSIAEVRIWDEAHSQSQLESYMYRRLGGGESGLAAYFPLNKGYSAATQNYVEGAAATISGASWQSDSDFADSLLTGADWVIAMPQPVSDAVLVLDGVDDYVDCGAIDFAQGEYTLEAWFKTSSSDKDSFLAATDGNHGILLEVGDNGRIRYLHRYPLGSSGGKNLYSSATVNDGQWHHVAAVVSSTNMLLYIDGQQVGSTSAPDPFPSSLDVVLGRLAITNNARPFNGSLSEVRIWNIARSQSEIQTNMNNRLWGSESGLLAYWPLNSPRCCR